MLDKTQKTKKDFGVFLPVANGGWIVSKNAPTLDGLWQQNLAAAMTADEVGLDFVMSMGKFRGFGGETNHWGVSMESITMMAAIAQATKRVKVWATAHTLLHNPAVIAKMITTIDHISGGRAGLNIVAGAFKEEFSQMGAWDDSMTHDDRYVLAEEWTTIVKRLWAEHSVDFDGRYFHMKDCVSDPKPISRPRPNLICAGMSDRGFQFSVRESDAVFVGGRTAEERRDASRRAKAVAETMGVNIKTYAMCTLIHDDTDAKAQALVKRYAEGTDMAAIISMLSSWGVPPEKLSAAAEQQGPFMTHTAVGSPATCAEKVEEFLTYCELDGLMLIFPDYVEGLKMFGSEILPEFRTVTA
ncbi:MAG: LLM class flavin-dependent oxidoreductase [Caulobacteraceae bacterium]|nr:LLM class flavin-dependent oxidoreductase [Caulobacteraceae bacterium]